MMDRLRRSAPWLRPLTEWALLFFFLVLAFWAATQSRHAPLLILLVMLHIITLNFSLPPPAASLGLVPVVAVSSLLALGLATAVTLLLAGYLLAELARPLWQPLWQPTPEARPTRRHQLTLTLIHLLSLLAAAAAYRQYGGVTPLSPEYLNDLSAFLALSLGFGAVYTGLGGAWWLAQKRPLAYFLRFLLLPLLSAGFLAQPFAILGGITLTLGGLPPFVVFCLGVAVFSINLWLTWQRQDKLEKHLTQFTILNHRTDALRQTLDLAEVLARTWQLVLALVSVDQLTLHLKEGAAWQTVHFTADDDAIIFTPQPLDDLAQWVVTHGRLLSLDPGNIHFAARHRLQPPQPAPTIWLGFPLTSADECIGVMVLQRFGPARPFSQWNQELLRSVATQAAAAIQNARLYGETVRLYNLTDEALAQRLKQLHALINAMTEGVLMVDRQGVIVMFNPLVATLFGNQTILRGHPLPLPAAPALGFAETQLETRLSQLQSGQIVPQNGRVLFTWPATSGFEANHRTIQRQETVINDRSGQIIGWLLLFRDVTQEQELARQREDLIRMMVHDLRNPLTTVNTTLQMVQNRLPPDEAESLALLQDAYNGSLDLLDMVDSLMDINRMEAGHTIADPDAMRLPPLVTQLSHRLQPLLAHKQISLTVETAVDLPPVWADAELVRRVLLNLLDNALKFTPAHGRISLHLQTEPAPDGQEPGIRCIITDSGPGVPPAFRQQLFNRFMRTNPGGAQVRGTGLGLTFCKMAIEAQHGRIWVEDNPDGGSQFVFTLPGIPDF